MQCVNCQFRNMPGTGVCARCGTSLALATAVIDVHPPRAGRTVKKLRRVLPVRRVVNRIRDGIADHATVRNAARHSAPAAAFLSVAFQSLIPGRAHFRTRQLLRGHVFLWTWLALLLPGLLLMGTLRGSLLLGLAFGVHSTAALDTVMLSFAEASTAVRTRSSVWVSVFLAAVLYVPAGWLLLHVADPITPTANIEPFMEGDTLLVNHWATPKPGRIVLYDLGRFTETLPRSSDVHVVRLYEGQRIDRVIAGPGDEVAWRDGQLCVNGALARWMPLRPGRLPAVPLSFTVPENAYAILPSTTPAMSENVDTWLTLSVIPADRIDGVVFLQKLPLSQWKVVR